MTYFRTGFEVGRQPPTIRFIKHQRKRKASIDQEVPSAHHMMFPWKLCVGNRIPRTAVEVWFQTVSLIYNSFVRSIPFEKWVFWERFTPKCGPYNNFFSRLVPRTVSKERETPSAQRQVFYTEIGNSVGKICFCLREIDLSRLSVPIEVLSIPVRAL